jgi:hypothetical protein
MKNVIENTKFLLIATAAVILVIVSTMLLTGKTRKSEESERPLLSKDMLFNLLISQDELPWDVILDSFRIQSDIHSYMLGSYNGKYIYDMVWYGPLTGPGGDVMESAEYSINISIAIADSPEEAVYFAEKQANSCSIRQEEIVDDEIISEYTDRAWGFSTKNMQPRRGMGIIYTRGPVLVHLYMNNKKLCNPSQLVELLACVSRKIDAALAGKPEPIPILPLTYQELQVDINNAFRMRSIGTYLWGKDSKTIALYDVNGVPRSLPAKQLSSGDYLVPLRHTGAILGPDGILEKRNELPEMKITMMGKTLIFYQNKSEILVNDKEVKLSRPIEFRGGEVLVPLTSLVQKALGKKITWSKRGSTMIGKVE